MKKAKTRLLALLLAVSMLMPTVKVSAQPLAESGGVSQNELNQAEEEAGSSSVEETKEDSSDNGTEEGEVPVSEPETSQEEVSQEESSGKGASQEESSEEGTSQEESSGEGASQEESSEEETAQEETSETEAEEEETDRIKDSVSVNSLSGNQLNIKSEASVEEVNFGGSIQTMFSTDSGENVWFFTGGADTEGSFTQLEGARSYIGHFEEYIRGTKADTKDEKGKNAGQRYVINGGKEGRSLTDIVSGWDSLVVSQTRAVAWLLSEEDYGQGKNGLEAFESSLKAYIDRALGLKANTGFAVIQLPYLTGDAAKDANIELYINKVKEVASAVYGTEEAKYSRILLVDHYQATKNIENWSSQYLSEGRLNEKGHLEIGRQLSEALWGSSQDYPNSRADSLLTSTAYARPESYLEQGPQVSAAEDSLQVTLGKDVVRNYGRTWNYELTLTTPEETVTVVKNRISTEGGAAFTIPGLIPGSHWLLQMRSEDGKVQLNSMEGILEDGEQGEAHKPLAFMDGASQSQQKLADRLEKNEPMRWLFIGDSTTQANLWTDGYDGAAQLFEKYLKGYLGREEDMVINTAVSGAAISDYLDENRAEVRLDYDADVVILMLGTNDALSGDQAGYKENLSSLITQIKEYNPGAYLVLRSPLYTWDSSRYPGLISFLQAMEEVAAEQGTAEFYLDQYRPTALALKDFLWLSAGQTGGDILYGDSLNPNELGQVLLFDQLIRELGLWDNDSPMTDLLYDTVETTVEANETDFSSAISSNEGERSITLNVSDLAALVPDLGSVTFRVINKTTGQSWEVKADREVQTGTADVTVNWAAGTTLTIEGLPWNERYAVEVRGWSISAPRELVLTGEQILGTDQGTVSLQLNGTDEKIIEGVGVTQGTLTATLGVSASSPAGNYTYFIDQATDSQGKDAAGLFGVDKNRLVVQTYLEYSETYTLSLRAVSGQMEGRGEFILKTVAAEEGSQVRPEDNPYGKEIPDGIWVAGLNDVTYTGSNIRQTIRVYDGTRLLEEKKDYTLTYKNNKNAYTYSQSDYTQFERRLESTGKATAVGSFDPKKAPQIIIKGKGNYTLSKTLYYNINPADLLGEGIETDNLTATYTGKKQTPVPVVTYEGKKLKYGKDFTIAEYDAAKKDKQAFSKAGTYDLTLQGKGNFTGKMNVRLTITVSVREIAMNKVSVKGVTALDWTGAALEQSGISVSYKKDTLEISTPDEAKDYTIEYVNNRDVGTATIILTGTGEDHDDDGYSYVGTKKVSFKIRGAAMSKAQVEGLQRSYGYTGSPIRPTELTEEENNGSRVRVVYQGTELTEGVQYKVSYQKNLSKGTATITFTGLASGGYTGTKKATFRIVADTLRIDGTKPYTVELEGDQLSGKGTAESPYAMPYRKGGVKPTVKITAPDQSVLAEGIDYTLSYKYNKAVAQSTDEKAPAVVIRGKGNYGGSLEIKFSILKKDLKQYEEVYLTAKDKVESSKAGGWKQSFKLYDADGKALSSKEYDGAAAVYRVTELPTGVITSLTAGQVLADSDTVPAGSKIEITVQMSADSSYTGEVKGSYRILKTGYDISKATIQIHPQEYTGREVTITENSQLKKAQLKIGKEIHYLYLKDGETEDQKQNIEVVGYEKNIRKGTAKVTFRGLEGTDFGGTKTVSFKIAGRSIWDWFKSLFGGEIVSGQNLLELKDIERSVLYYKGKEIEAVDLDNGLPRDVENYYLKLEMGQLPALYVGIDSFVKAEDELYAETSLQEFVQYHNTEEGLVGTKGLKVKVDYTLSGQSQGGIEELLAEMAADPSGTYELTSDLDASKVTEGYLVPGTFTGTLKGNGFTIYGQKVPFFETLGQGAEISGLRISGAEVSGKAILAVTINGATVEDCHVQSSTLNGGNGVGTFAAGFNSGNITGCTAVDITINATDTIGGIVGQSNAGTQISDCYVSATLKGSSAHASLGARLGGISGWHKGSIDGCYTKVNLQASKALGNGGLIGGPNTEAGAISNSISLATGTGYTIAGIDQALTSADSVYEHSDSTTTANTATSGNKVSEITKEFIVDTLGMSESIWNRIKANAAPLSNAAMLEKVPGYDSSRQIAYYNMEKFAPFLSTEDVVSYGNQISDAGLQTQKIRMILPMNAASEHMVGIDKERADQVEKILVVFEDGSSRKYRLKSSHIADGLVAVYTVRTLDIPYHFNKYVGKVDESLKTQVLGVLKAYDYTKDIASTTEEEEKRQYVDYYNETVKTGKLEEFLDKLLLTQENYPGYLDNSWLKAEVRSQLMNELPRLVYSYNYFSKWYDINVGDVNLTDMLYFDGELLNRGLTADYLTDQLYGGTRNTYETVAFFTKAIAPMVGTNIYETFEFFIKVSGEDDPNDWFRDNFKGILKEQAPIGAPEGMEVPYRIWDNLIRCQGQDAMLLPVLTAPQEDMILVSIPSQIFLSSINRYMKENTAETRKTMSAHLDQYCKWAGTFYGTSMNLVTDAERILNSFVNVNYESPFNYQSTKYSGSQHPLDNPASEEPVFKWVNEAIGRISAKNGTAAYANGTNTFWVAYSAFWSRASFNTFTHESAHNQDGRYFYSGYGRRNPSGGEAHADGTLAQAYGDGVIVFNMTEDFPATTETSNNLTVERINSEEKIKDYYQEMYETGYLLDYLLAEAFLKLTAEEQAKVVVRAREEFTELKGAEGKQTNSMITHYERVTREEIEAMNLQTVEDLVNNKLTLRGEVSVTAANAVAPSGNNVVGVYGVDSFYTVYWYQPNNPTGTPDGLSFKRLGSEMTGLGGYANGFVKWLSGASANDLDALQQITGDADITWNTYKINRYKAVETNLDSVPWFNKAVLVNEMVEALKQDGTNGNLNQSTNLKKIYYHIIKRATNDFTKGDAYSQEVVEIGSAAELIAAVEANEMGSYRLTTDIDFSGQTAVNGAYMKQFIGDLDGNGHSITGLTYPLFDKITYASIRNVIIDTPQYAADAKAVIALTSSNVVLDGVELYDANTSLPAVQTKTRGKLYYEFNVIGF